MFIEYIYIYIYEQYNPERYTETFQNWNISFQLKKQNTFRNEIDNLALNYWAVWMMISCKSSEGMTILRTCGPHWNKSLEVHPRQNLGPSLSSLTLTRSAQNIQWKNI